MKLCETDLPSAGIIRLLKINIAQFLLAYFLLLLRSYKMCISMCAVITVDIVYYRGNNEQKIGAFKNI